MKLRSIRWRLALSYAAIALLAALALGLVLLTTVRGYYQARERAYLQANAGSIAGALLPILQADRPKTELQNYLLTLAFLSQTHIRLYGPDHTLLADASSQTGGDVVLLSGMPLPPANQVSGQPSLGTAEPPTDTVGQATGVIVVGAETQSGSWTTTTLPQGSTGVGADEPDKMVVTSYMALPAEASMFGFQLTDVDQSPRPSNEVLSLEIQDQDKQVIATLELSEGPGYGQQIVAGVMQGWLVSSAVAVLLAALVGWWVSRQVSAPVLALTIATRRMASGDLGVRAAVRNQDEIGELAGSFNEMVERVESTVETLRRFASDAAHELNTPLTALRANVELALQSDGPAARASLERALEQGSRLESLTRDLLDLSRLEAQANGEPVEPVDLVALAREQAEPFASQAEQAGVTFELDLPAEPLTVMGERSRLGRALRNLLENAVKFTPPGGRIICGAVREGEEAHLWVQDSGIGIPEEDRSMLFHRFHRGRNASGYPGSGLGLAILRAIAERHHGRIEVEHLAPGTRFRLIFPGQ